jgi:hypothetical protein
MLNVPTPFGWAKVPLVGTTTVRVSLSFRLDCPCAVLQNATAAMVTTVKQKRMYGLVWMYGQKTNHQKDSHWRDVHIGTGPGSVHCATS